MVKMVALYSKRDSKSKAKRIEYEQKEQNKNYKPYICNKVITIKETQPKIERK